MTVAELIKELQDCDPEARVHVGVDQLAILMNRVSVNRLSERRKMIILEAWWENEL